MVIFLLSALVTERIAYLGEKVKRVAVEKAVRVVWAVTVEKAARVVWAV